MFCKADKEYLVPGIEEDIITTSEPEDKMHVHVIPVEVERVRLNEFFLSHQRLYTSRKMQTQKRQRMIGILA